MYKNSKASAILSPYWRYRGNYTCSYCIPGLSAIARTT